MLKWDGTRGESETVLKIMLRAASLLNLEEQLKTSRLELSMDITACHLNGCALDLDGLLAAPDQDFLHDVMGISKHINRQTGQLEESFLPRYAVNQGL